MKTVVGAMLLGAFVGCAPAQKFHPGRTTLAPDERPVLTSIKVKQDGGMEKFWRRDGVSIGLVKWSEEQSSSVPEAPSALLELVRDELGRVNRQPREGEQISVAVTVFDWRRPWFRRVPEVQYEVVGRDRAGQLLWMGQDRFVIPRAAAATLADTDEQLAARELARRLRTELGL